MVMLEPPKDGMRFIGVSLMYNNDVLHRCGDRVGFFYDILPKRLTVERPKTVNGFDVSHRTLFREVTVEPYSESMGMRDFLEEVKDISPVMQTGEAWKNKVFDVFCTVVEKMWDKNTVKIVSHSSGWDSRLISLAIMKCGLNDEDTLFCEGKGEYPHFERIMDVLGIRNYRIYRRDVHPNKHSFPYVMDAANAFEGLVDYPLNELYTPYKEFNDVGEKPTHFAGCGANVITDGMKNIRNYYSVKANNDGRMAPYEKLRNSLRWLYYCHLSKFKLAGSPAFPFLDHEFIKLIVGIENWQIVEDRFSEVIVKAIEPKLANVERVSVYDLQNMGYRTFDDETMKSLIDIYKSTWYGRHIDSEPVKEISYCQWWTDWSAALICDRLIKEGHEIEFRNVERT
jgi:hypothetical protein